MKFKKNKFFLTILGLVTALFLITQTAYLILKGEGQRANIVVDASIEQGKISPFWRALAQGGEEKDPFSSIENEIAELKPIYIRFDHLYDFYEVVDKKNGQLSFNWEATDRIVDQILQAGALPFICLSYMPPAIAQNGEITAPPQNWDDWAKVVEKTIQHYSGRNEKNLTGVIYEVWNEPDLFGGWTIGGQKDYRLLYQYAIKGANQAQQTNPFKIGGPGTTALYQNWVNKFLNYIAQNRLRLDFYSWHRYSTNPEVFIKDVDQVDLWLFQNAGYSLEKYLTEWGPVSQNSPINDSNFAAAHLIATVRQLLHRVDLAFTFEIKDGPSPTGEKFWGRWGLLTHEKAGPVQKKPRYFALQLLDKMAEERVSLKGEGTWITGFASKNQNKISLILANLDQKNQHFESVPITFINLENDTYFYRETFLNGPGKTASEKVTDAVLKKEVLLSPNNIVVIELQW